MKYVNEWSIILRFVDKLDEDCGKFYEMESEEGVVGLL